MGPTGGSDEGAADATLAWLRRAHPDAVISALTPEAEATPVPAELGFPTGNGRAIQNGSGLDTISPEDRIAVIRAWERARSRRVAQVGARLVTGERVVVHFIDLRDRYGVILVATVPDDACSPFVQEDGEQPLPRVCWVRREPGGSILEVDVAAVEMFGWTQVESKGQPSLAWIHPDDHDRALENWVEVLCAPGESRRFRVRHLRRDGSYVWLDVTNHNRLNDPEHGDILSEMVDISDEMAVHEALRESEQLLRELTDALPVGVVQFAPDRSTVHENEQLRAIVGAPGLLGLLDAVVDDDRDDLAAAVDAVLREGAPAAAVEVRLRGDRVCRVTLRPLTDDLGAVTGGLACVDDVTEEAQLRRELEVRATFDSLTACLNRSAILGALDDVAAEGPGTGVVFVDLDRFKPVNDAFGHAAGDELLATIGERLRVAVREVDLVGRLGGDEFLVVCPGVSSPDDVDAIARRVADLVAQPLTLGEHVVQPNASIGVAWAPAGTDPATLVARADAAMYEAKRARREDAGSSTR